MNQYEALLGAVIAYPHDDTPRLIMADFLEIDAYPAQPEKAAVIRLQVWKGRVETLSSAEEMQLCQLMGDNMERWYVEAGIPEALRPYVFFDRGFITTNFVKENLRLYNPENYDGRDYREPQTEEEQQFAENLQKLFDTHPNIVRRPPKQMHEDMPPVYLVVERCDAYEYREDSYYGAVIRPARLNSDDENSPTRQPIENL